MTEEQARDRILQLFDRRSLGVLATSGPKRVHASLVAFAASGDLREILFATGRSTRKFELIRQSPAVALLVDDRSNEVRDFRDAIAVTAHGTAREVPDDRREGRLASFLDKHPYLNDFVQAPSCALLGIAVESYDLVGNFQEVFELRVGNGLDPRR
jgi:nitroimidazol reductase NimA-like FMN-containing flavoprotein (pyridoxamine 5'-phosphate oxidase superfamily)